MIVLTADRPPELRENGAGQTIDQLKLYGSAAKWFVEVGVDVASEENLRWIRTLACRVFYNSISGRPGPVHLNFPLREPLTTGTDLPEDATGRDDGAPTLSMLPPTVLGDEYAVAEIVELLRSAERGVIVAGSYAGGDETPSVLAALAVEAGYPLLADPLSGARMGDGAIAHYDALLRDQQWSDAAKPDFVIRVGDLPTSKPLRQWLASLDARQIFIGQLERLQDPAGVVDVVLPGRAALTLSELTGLVDRQNSAYLTHWRKADQTASSIFSTKLKDTISEPQIVRALAQATTNDTQLFVASSMPIRDVETFWPGAGDQVRILANRGANGIDGTIASALGAARAHSGPTALLIGDVALAYDISSLLSLKRLELNVTVVVINNGGGGIFDFLPISDQKDVHEQHVTTPHELSFERAAELYGLRYEEIKKSSDLVPRLSKAIRSKHAKLIEIKTDRAENVALHRELWPSVATALAAAESPQA